MTTLGEKFEKVWVEEMLTEVTVENGKFRYEEFVDVMLSK